MPLREHTRDRIGTAIASANSGCSPYDLQLRADDGELWLLPPLRPKRAACGVGGLRSEIGQRKQIML